jgi:OOP family OmpA-OmpF porin
MKKILLLLVVCAFTFAANSQVLKRLADRAKNKTEQKAGEKVDKAIDDAVDGQPKKVKTEEDGDVKIKNEDGSKIKTEGAAAPSMKFNTKYDFVQGEKIIGYEDFSNTDIGDFPTRWNTNATAEVVTLDGREGKWLKFNKTAVFYPEFIKDLPENFTLEFDVAVNKDFRGSDFAVNIANLVDANDFQNYYHNVSWKGRDAIHLLLKPGFDTRSKASSRIMAASDGNYRINNTIDFASWDNQKNNFAHVSLWRQKTRLRVYINGEKVWDLPRGFDPSGKYNGITFAADYSYGPEDYILLGNIRLAVGAPDTRNKLVTEGKFVTNGIRFAVNSDRIEPDSYGVLKEVAGVLKENADLKIKIIGHTDTDGDDKANLELSKKRAAAVKNTLASEFGIDAARIQTDGMGESKPIGDNKTTEGKAQNRRVEFVRL